LRPDEMLSMQSTLGNAAVQRILAGRNQRPTSFEPAVRLTSGPTIQAKLLVGSANDKYEQEADQVAGEVASGSVAPKVQRTAKPNGGFQVGAAGGDAAPALESRLHQSSSGAALPEGVRRQIEPKLGADLGGVKVHTGPEAASLNQQLGAKAFTYKNNIYYGAGQSPNDLRLTAHEAVHTVQQGATGGQVARQMTKAGMGFQAGTPGSQPIIQRALDEGQKEQWREQTFTNLRNIAMVRSQRQGNDRADKELTRLVRSISDLTYAFIDAPATAQNNSVQVNSLYSSLAVLAALGQGGGYVKTGQYEEQNNKLKDSGFKNAGAFSYFRHAEKVYRNDDGKAGSGYLDQLDSDKYGKRIGFHALGALMNVAFPVSLAGIMGGMAVTKMRALFTRSTERKLMSDKNSVYIQPLHDFRAALDAIKSAAVGQVAVQNNAQTATGLLENFLKKRKAQGEEVTDTDSGTLAGKLSKKWMTGKFLAGLFKPKTYGRR